MSVDVNDETSVETIGEPSTVPDHLLEVRRRAGLALVLGAGASLVAIAYLGRAVSHGGVLAWLLFVVLGAIGVVNLAALLDARTPLLVADDLGVRLRLGRSWVGLPWGGLQEVEHCPRRGWWRDGLLVVRPHYVQRVLEDLDPGARRAARLNRRLHRAPLAVPLGLGTRVLGGRPDLTTALLLLADGRTPVLEAVVETEPEPWVDDEPVTHEELTVISVADLLAAHGVTTSTSSTTQPAPTAEEPSDASDESPVAVPVPWRLPDPRPALARLIGDVAARFDRLEREEPPVADDEPELVASATPDPARAAATAARVEVRYDAHVEPHPIDMETQAWDALALLPEVDEAPAVDPVIGPRFAAARAHLGLGVDELADRTRIRPHVIEAIEIDDFSACGGDFYARGHLRTLARVLGVDVAGLLETYDERYADAPIDASRVFEAELAGAGSMRATRGGPNWSVLVAAVMALVLCWSIARLVTAGPGHVPDRAILSGSGGPNHTTKAPVAEPVAVELTAAGGGAHVVVRNGQGRVAFSGDLAFGQSRTVRVSPPVRIRSSDGGVTVRVAGQDRGRMGPAGRPASSSYVPHG